MGLRDHNAVLAKRPDVRFRTSLNLAEFEPFGRSPILSFIVQWHGGWQLWLLIGILPDSSQIEANRTLRGSLTVFDRLGIRYAYSNCSH